MQRHSIPSATPQIARGTRLRYKGFEQTPSVEITAVLVPGHQEHDGGLPGIGVCWLKRRHGLRRFFYPCRSVHEFFSDMRFSNLEVCQ